MCRQIHQQYRIFESSNNCHHKKRLIVIIINDRVDKNMFLIKYIYIYMYV